MNMHDAADEGNVINSCKTIFMKAGLRNGTFRT